MCRHGGKAGREPVVESAFSLHPVESSRRIPVEPTDVSFLSGKTPIVPRGLRTSIARARTSVSAPLGAHPKTLAPLGSQIARTVNPIRAHPNIARKGTGTSVAGGADLCVRSAGHSTESPSPHGQANSSARKIQSALIRTLRHKGPADGGLPVPGWLFAHWDGGSPTTHWSGHRGPAAVGRESRGEKVESRIWGAVQRSRHGGPRGRGTGLSACS